MASAAVRTDGAAIETVARSCGQVAVGCADAAGYVAGVAKRIADQAEMLATLEQVTAALEADQRRVADSTDEARLLSEQARDKLEKGAALINGSIAEFGALTELVAQLGAHMTGFAAAMDQVQRVSASIDTIARKTNMLALNATIEAERAGDAGRTFAVVADEVKKLAQETRGATDEIASTVASLTREAETVISRIDEGVRKSKLVTSGFATIDETVKDVTEIVGHVDQQTDGIAKSTGMIHDAVARVREGLTLFAGDARENGGQLGQVHNRMNALEQEANAMLHGIVEGGFATADRHFVEMALAGRDRVVAIAERALETGEVDIARLFDTDYRLIAGSNPERFDNRANDFADRWWRPEIDRISKSADGIITAAVTDVNGYLPTHTTEASRAPTGDPAHDSVWCRNRRILFGDIDKKAKSSAAPFFMGVYRRESQGGYQVVRNVYVPMIIGGRRWGDFEIAYAIE